MSDRQSRARREAERLRSILPDWVNDIEEAGGITRFILLVLVSAILSLWAAVLGAFEEALAILARFPLVVIDRVALLGAPFWLLIDGLETVQETVASVAASAGLAAPLVALIAWMVPVMIVIAILNFAIGLANTYLPLQSLPVVGRWFS